jgi:hypothetical protein
MEKNTGEVNRRRKKGASIVLSTRERHLAASMQTSSFP